MNIPVLECKNFLLHKTIFLGGEKKNMFSGGRRPLLAVLRTDLGLGHSGPFVKTVYLGFKNSQMWTDNVLILPCIVWCVVTRTFTPYPPFSYFLQSLSLVPWGEGRKSPRAWDLCSYILTIMVCLFMWDFLKSHYYCREYLYIILYVVN